MEILKTAFSPIIAVLRFINSYFKAMIFLLILFLIFIYPDYKNPNPPNLAQINLTDAIMGDNEILEQIHKVAKNDDIKGVLLFIDSPGGALAPSVEIAIAVKNLRAKKPVIAYASGTMTSGSYYGGVNADKILANPGSFIGSIGVIIQGAEISELADKIGISQQVVKAGEFKEVGTFARKWSESEKKELENLVQKSYEMFVRDVADARNLDINASEKWANARVFLAADAKKVGLIDELSDYYSAKRELEILSAVSTPIWQKQPAYEKAFNNLLKNGLNFIIDAIFKTQIR